MNITINRKSISCIQIKKEKNKMKTVFTANRTRKSLSLDEMDMIGGGGSFSTNGVTYNEEEFNRTIWAAAESFGYEIALSMFKLYTNTDVLPCGLEAYAKEHGGSDGARMEIICKAF
jgi:hypothetical protein